MTETLDDIAKEGEFMAIAQMRFRMSCPDDVVPPAEKAKDKAEFLRIVKEHNNVHVYDAVCQELSWKPDESVRQPMLEANQAKLKELEDKILDAEENLGENEVREAMVVKAQFLSRIGDKDKALEAFSTAESHPKTTTGQKMDILFSVIRIGLFWRDIDLVKKNVEKAKVMIEEGGDWERRNRLKVYEAMLNLAVRDFKKGALLLLDSVATFTATELFDYDAFIFYAVTTSVLSLDRKTLKTRVIEAPEVLQVIHKNPALQQFLNSIYDCQYKEFFQALVDITDALKRDRFLAPHARYFIRECRVVAYHQFLEPYKSVRLPSMAASFGVGVEFMDRELGDFVSSGRLSCKIDKVSGIVESNRPDCQNSLYQQTIKQGDLLLNRIQKISRVITI